MVASVPWRRCFIHFWVFVAGLVWLGSTAEAIRFELDRRECWVHDVPTDRDLMHVSFVVIKLHNAWGGSHNRRAAHVGVDLSIDDPGGQQVYIVKQRMQEKFNLIAIQKGPYKFCFKNRVSMIQTIDFNVHIGHLTRDEPIKDEHLYVLFAQIARVEDALFDVQFEQQWLHSQTAQQAQVANGLSRRVLYKAALESLALIACSVLQIVLLQRLFEKKLGACPPRLFEKNSSCPFRVSSYLRRDWCNRFQFTALFLIVIIKYITCIIYRSQYFIHPPH